MQAPRGGQSVGVAPVSSAVTLATRAGVGVPAPTGGAALPTRRVNGTLDVLLGMNNGGRRWLIDGVGYGDHGPLGVKAGERVAFALRNQKPAPRRSGSRPGPPRRRRAP